MSSVFHIVLILANHRLPLLPHVATEVLVVELAEAVQGRERKRPVTSDML